MLALLLPLLPGVSSYAGDEHGFTAWKVAYGKAYATVEEEARRFEAFLLNKGLVEAAHLQETLGVTLALNEFADRAPGEFTAERNGLQSTAMPRPSSTHIPSGQAIPLSVDWREKGLVAEVKNQGSCGSCWAFSTVVSIEGQHAKNSGTLVPLSEQNLVDCVKNEVIPGQGWNETCCSGCKGGLMADAFQYMIDHQHGGIDTEAAYPYTGLSGKCAFKATQEGAAISKWVAIPQGDEDALLDAVATVGPVSIGVDAAIGWQLYSGGILKPRLCSSDPKHLDHGVAIVGYGSEVVKGTSTDYWIIRNSWGKRWGESGYLRIVRGQNACGLANAASYPIDTPLVEEVQKA